MNNRSIVYEHAAARLICTNRDVWPGVSGAMATVAAAQIQGLLVNERKSAVRNSVTITNH